MNENVIIADSSYFSTMITQLDQISKSLSKSISIDYLTTEEVCNLLKVTSRTLANYTSSGILGVTKLGRSNYYKLSEIINTLEKNYLPPFEKH